jgi:Protein of unknown function (DUF3365)
VQRRGLWVCCFLCAIAVVLVGAGPRDLAEYREADAVAKKMIDDTQNLLLREVHEKGPTEALTECSAVALSLAQQYVQQGWRVRRVSLRIRNPADAPDTHERKILTDYEILKEKGRLKPDVPSVYLDVQDGKRTLRYMRPILITNPVCLQCHGRPEDLLPAVKERLQTLYPHDQATGYQLNDLRGAVSIDIPLPEE